MNSRWLLLFSGLCLFLTAPAFAQDQHPALDGPKHPVSDELLDKLAGSWKAEGTIVGQPASQAVDAQWALHHQFLRIHMLASTARPPSDTPYEAMVYVGYNNMSEHYVCHWLDIYGGRSSETLGFGQRNGQAIEFVFEYPTGPFHTTFRWIPETSAWQWTMRTKTSSGQWIEFASLTLTRPAAQPSSPPAVKQ